MSEKVELRGGYAEQYGFHDEEKYVFKARPGLDRELVEQISKMKNEPPWMTEFRLKALEIFFKKPMPTWGNTALLNDIKFNEIYYYLKPMDKQGKTWEDVPADIKRTFERLGIPEAELSARFEAATGSPQTWKQRRAIAEAAQTNWAGQAGGAKERRFLARSELLAAYPNEFAEFDAKDDGNDRFDRRLEEIRQHELERFEKLASDRRNDWETRLQEDVLDRLRERLEDAKQTITDFRSILHRSIGGYRYTLSQTRDQTHAALWKLLDAGNEGFKPGDPLLDEPLREQIEAAKKELMQAVDNPHDKRSAALLDYRTYHRYNLFMVPADHADDSEGRISLQDRGRNLSGGEGQAPFFVAMLAAFYRVYDRDERQRQSNLGLVVMDEAFSKLSAGHINECLGLAESFGLQLILAFPMDRLATMVQHADSIIQCRVKRTADAKGAPVEIVNDVIYWQRQDALAEFLA